MRSKVRQVACCFLNFIQPELTNTFLIMFSTIIMFLFLIGFYVVQDCLIFSPPTYTYLPLRPTILSLGVVTKLHIVLCFCLE